MGWFIIFQGGQDLGGLSNMIRQEKSYWFSTPGQYFVVFCFCWNKKMLCQHTLKPLPQSIIATTPQVNQELPCWHNYGEEEVGKVGQGKDWGGEFFHSEGRRDR